MKRASLALLCCALLLPMARAADFPTQPIKFIVPFTPGGSPDIVARLVAKVASSRISQPITIENRAGGAGVIAVEALLRSNPDGHTLLLGSTFMVIQPLLAKKPAYNIQTDLLAVTNVVSAPFVWVVNPQLPVKTLQEFVAYSKANPTRSNVATSGEGGTAHLAALLLNLRAGIKLTHLPYKGEALALNDLIGNHVQAVPSSYSAAAGHIAGGRLRALAVTGRYRMKQLPDVLTFEESGFSRYQVGYWNGFVVPAKTPRDIVEKLNALITEAIRTPEVVSKLEDLAFRVEATSPADFTSFINSEVAKWSEVIRATGIVLPN